jgi:hypothetical protein
VSHRRSPLLVLVVLLAGGLPAIGGASAAGSPEAAADALLDAVVARDADAIATVTCPELTDAVAAALDPLRGLAPDEATIATLAAAVTLRIDDRAVDLIEETGDAATVALAGRLHAAIDRAAARDWVAERLAAAGQPADGATVDASLDALQAALAVGRDLTTTVEVIRVGGDWLVCGGLGLAVPGEPVPGRADLCALASIDEVAAATGLPITEAWASPDSCTWAGATGATDPFSITALVLEGELAPLQAVWKPGRAREVAGRSTWATRNGTWVQLEDGLLAVLPTLEWSDGAADADSIDVAIAVAELVVPRLP